MDGGAVVGAGVGKITSNIGPRHAWPDPASMATTSTWHRDVMAATASCQDTVDTARARIQWIQQSGYNEGKSVLLQRKHLLYAAWRHFRYHHSDEGQWVTHAARTQEDNFKTLEC